MTALLAVFKDKRFLELCGLFDGLKDNRMAILDYRLIELPMCCETLRVLLIINGTAVLLQCLDETAIIFEHLAVEAEKIVVFVVGDF